MPMAASCLPLGFLSIFLAYNDDFCSENPVGGRRLLMAAARRSASRLAGFANSRRRCPLRSLPPSISAPVAGRADGLVRDERWRKMLDGPGCCRGRRPEALTPGWYFATISESVTLCKPFAILSVGWLRGF